MPVLSPCEDIKSLIERFANVQVVSRAVVHGVEEYHSNCPWCGGHDRFITRPETGQYTCATRSSGCGKHGDMIDFLEDEEAGPGMSKREAIEEIGLDPDDLDFILQTREDERYQAQMADPRKPWRERAEEESNVAQALLRRPGGTIGLKALRDRGFTKETILNCRLGYIPLADDGWFKKESYEDWGLFPEECNHEHIWLYEGILIPWYSGKHIRKLEVRRLQKLRKNKDGSVNRYMYIDGSQDNSLYNVDAITPDKPVVLVEGALDAIAGMQACGDLATFVATGGTSKAKHPLWIERLKQAPYVLIAFDDDEGGDTGAVFWKENLPDSMRWAPYGDDVKDVGDMLMAGEDVVRAWLSEGISEYTLFQSAKHIPVHHWSEDDQPAPTDTLARENTASELEADFFADFPPAHTSSSTYRTTSYAEMSAEAILDLVKRLQRAGVRMEVKDGCLEYDADFFLPVEVRRFFFNSQGLIIRWLQGQVSQQSTCCRCGAPADHHSPGGHGYCTEHYLCVRGHAPDWVQTSSGAWVCRCILDALIQSAGQPAAPADQELHLAGTIATLSSATLNDATFPLQGQEAEPLPDNELPDEPTIDVHTLQPGIMPDAGQALLHRFLQEVPYEYLMWDVTDSGIKADYIPRSRYIKNMTACLESGDQVRCLSAFDALSHCIERYHRKQEHHQPGTLIQPRMDRLQASHMATSEEQAHFLSVGVQSGYPHVEISVCASLVEGSDAWHTFARTHEQSELQRVIDTLSAAGSGKEQRRIRNLVIPPRTYTTPVPRFEFVTDESGQRRLQQVGYWPEVEA